MTISRFSHHTELPAEEALQHMGQLLYRPVTGTWPVEANVLKVMEETACDPSAHYRRFTVPKGYGRVREIEAPNEALKFIQAEINAQLLSRAHLPDGVYGFRRGFSGGAYAGMREMMDKVGQANDGAGNIEAVYQTDIKDFFPSVTQEQVREQVRHLLFRTLHRWEKGPQLPVSSTDKLADLITQLCCLDGRLPQGAPTSPALANMVGAARFDRAIQRELDDERYVYGRYADDIVILGAAPIAERTRGLVGSIIQSSGFQLAHNKSLYREGWNHYNIWGLQVMPATEDAPMQFRLPAKFDRRWSDEMFELIHADAPATREEFDERVSPMLGRLNYAYQVMRYGRPGGPRSTLDDIDVDEPLLPKKLSFAWKKFVQRFHDRLPEKHRRWYMPYGIATKQEIVYEEATPAIFEMRIDPMCDRRGLDPAAFESILAEERARLDDDIAAWDEEDLDPDIQVAEGIRSVAEMVEAEEDPDLSAKVTALIARVIAFQEQMFAGRFKEKVDEELITWNEEDESLLPAEVYDAWRTLREALKEHPDKKIAHGLKYLFWNKEKTTRTVEERLPLPEKKAERSSFIHLPGFNDPS